MKKWRKHNMEIGEEIARERNLHLDPYWHDDGMVNWEKIKKLSNRRILPKERRWFFQSEVATPSDLLIKLLVKTGILKMGRAQA